MSGLRVEHLIEDEAAYIDGEADRVVVDGQVSRERVRGDFKTRFRVQWVRYWWLLLREILCVSDWWHSTNERVSEAFQTSERYRNCPHRTEWFQTTANGVLHCRGCGESWLLG